MKSPVSYLFLLFVWFAINSCKKDEPSPKIKIQFKDAALTVAEGSQIKVKLSLDKAAQKQEFVMIQLSGTTAVYGSDFSIDNSVNLSNSFAVAVPKDSLSVSFSLLAIADYVDEQDEIVHAEIVGTSDALAEGELGITDITIQNKARYPDDNRAISFDGIDDYIDLGNIYDDLSLPVTISAWVYVDPSVPTTQALPIFDSQDNLPYYDGINFNTGTASFIGIQYGDGQGENNIAYRRAKSATISNIAGRWVSLTAIMRGATDMDLYLDGVNVGGDYAGTSNLPLKSLSPTENAKIGILNGNGQTYRFKGKIDELKIWNRSLSESEVQVLIFKKLDSTANGLIGYWSFDEPNGNLVNDGSINKFNGTLIGNPTRVHSESPVSK